MKFDMNTWLYTLFACSCISSMILYLSPDDRSRGIAEMGCTCVMILALIMPLSNLDLEDYLSDLSEYRERVSEELAFLQSSADEINKEIIEQRTQEYILNEAESQGIKLSAALVEAVQSEEGDFIPAQVSYYSESMVPEQFIHSIETQLGIPKERQITYETTGSDW